ncbi:MAG: peptidyl-alpha-hydroxyglycine alpha-amidating lyase family protein [Gammaproteobacteria bacterium]|nr:peptidyl-alpha-hydroxyglycine alpha-amidating lyase family protein [Gammaproteobacteria bacterium]
MKENIAFEVIEGWEKLPEGWSFVEVAGVATDSRDRVYVFNRGEHPMIVFDADGNFLDAWGEGLFTNAHGIYIGPDDRIFAADNFDHTVRIFSTDGTLLKTLGEKDQPSDTGFVPGQTPVQYGGEPFNRVTNVALDSAGDLYIADGYGNARVHKFTADGEHLFSWGEPGTGPGEFRLPHAIAIDEDDRVIVADRENSRIQVFSPKGEYLTEWTGISRPDDIFIDNDAGIMHIAELGGWAAGSDIPPHVPPASVCLVDLDGTLISRFGSGDPVQPGNFFAPHGIWADSKGDLYVAEVIVSYARNRGLTLLDCAALQKFARIR